MPQKGSALDVQCVKGSAITAWGLHKLHSEVQNSPHKGFHMLCINFAEVPEVVLSHKMGCCLLHGCNVQLAMLNHKVRVLSVPGVESEATQTQKLRQDNIL